MAFLKRDDTWIIKLHEEQMRQAQKRLDEFDYYISGCIYSCLRKNPSLLEHSDVYFLWEYAKKQLFKQHKDALKGLKDAEKERFLNLLFDAKEKGEDEWTQDYSVCVSWCLSLLIAYRSQNDENDAT